MASTPSRYWQGQAVALGTMHGKERAVARPFARWLGARILVPDGIDTDAYGTFTGETPRHGTMLEAARAKARLAIERAGLPLGTASEGGFTPDPMAPTVVRDTELVVFIDQERDLEVREAVVAKRTNYAMRSCAPGDDIRAFLDRIRFPSHGIAVRPLRQVGTFLPIKGVHDRQSLDDAIRRASEASFDSRALLVTDMRAHCNPTRMAVIRAAASRLARRLATPCERCGTPGFGATGLVKGLPCGACGLPTGLVLAEIHSCQGCGFEDRRPLSRSASVADPMHCRRCNP